MGVNVDHIPYSNNVDLIVVFSFYEEFKVVVTYTGSSARLPESKSYFCHLMCDMGKVANLCASGF